MKIKDKLQKANQNYQVAIISSLAVLIVFVLSIWTYFLSFGDISNGIIIGGVIGVIPYILFGLTDNKENKSLLLPIIITIVRFILIAAAIVFSTYFYFKKQIHVVNPFSLVASYTISLIVFAIILLLEKKKNV